MRKLGIREWVAVGVALAVAVALFFGGAIWIALFGDAAPTASAPTTAPVNTIQPSTNPPQSMTNISKTPGIEIYDETVGTGAVASGNKAVTVHYVGVFENGQKFDSSVDRGTPFTFQLGTGMVIKGWDIGVEGMKVGGVRKLVISSDYGYGPNDYGSIPGGSTLIFEVQLLEVK